MKHIQHFEKFAQITEHIYHKALAKDSQNWAKNYEKLIAHLKKQIEDRQIKDFKNNSDEASFTIRGKKYKIDKAGKLFLYTKGRDEEVELDLTEGQVSELIKALRKPFDPKSKTAGKYGKKPYLSEDEE